MAHAIIGTWLFVVYLESKFNWVFVFLFANSGNPNGDWAPLFFQPGTTGGETAATTRTVGENISEVSGTKRI